MITDIVLEGVVSYDKDFDVWRVDNEGIENMISNFEGRKVVVTITEI